MDSFGRVVMFHICMDHGPANSKAWKRLMRDSQNHLSLHGLGSHWGMPQQPRNHGPLWPNASWNDLEFRSLPPYWPFRGGGVKNVSYNNFFLIYAIYIVRFWYLGGGGVKNVTSVGHVFLTIFTPPPLPFLENQLFFEGGGGVKKRNRCLGRICNKFTPPPLCWKILCFLRGGGGEDVTGGGDVHVTNLRGGSVKNATGDACSPKLRYMFFSFFFSISHFNRENESVRVGRYANFMHMFNIFCTCGKFIYFVSSLKFAHSISYLQICENVVWEVIGFQIHANCHRLMHLSIQLRFASVSLLYCQLQGSGKWNCGWWYRLSNSISSVLPFSFPTSKLRKM